VSEFERLVCRAVLALYEQSGLRCQNVGGATRPGCNCPTCDGWAALRELESRLDTPAWATTPPTAPGWYWWRQFGGSAMPVEVKAGGAGELVVNDGHPPSYFADWSEWCGPIASPTGSP
jgi:hypothetical protein